MKKRLFAAALALMLVCCLPVSAFAMGALPQPDGGFGGGYGGIVPDGSYGGGSGLTNGYTGIAPDNSYGVSNGYTGIQPDSGLSNNAGGSNPVVSFGISVPAIMGQPYDVSSAMGGVPAALRVDAYSANGLALGYQWYSLGSSPNGMPNPISGAVFSSYTPSQVMGTRYYCVGVYAISDGMRSSEVMSQAAAVSYYGIEIARNPSKTQYSVGSAVSLDGLVVRVYEANGGYWESSNGSALSVYPQTLTTEGSIPVQVSYGQSSATFYVTVTPGTAADDPNHQHVFGEWETTKPATCVTTGTRTRTCTECGETETEDLMKTDHNWDEGTVTKQPTNTSNGATLYTCTVCKANRSEIIPAGTQSPEPTTSLDAAAAGQNPSSGNVSTGGTYANNVYTPVTPPGASSAAAAVGQPGQSSQPGQTGYTGQTDNNGDAVGTLSNTGSSKGGIGSSESSGWWLIPVSAALLVGTGIGAYYLMRRRGGE